MGHSIGGQGTFIISHMFVHFTYIHMYIQACVCAYDDTNSIAIEGIVTASYSLL